ncbi:hypothetical protein D3C76_1753810 [compost metagenome]
MPDGAVPGLREKAQLPQGRSDSPQASIEDLPGSHVGHDDLVHHPWRHSLGCFHRHRIGRHCRGVGVLRDHVHL